MESISRRRFLQTMGSGATALAAGRFLQVRERPSRPARPTAPLARESRPRHGGTLNAGFTGGSSADTLNPMSPVANVDYARVNNLFDLFVRMTPDATPVLYLAEELEPNSDATLWTLRCRSGVTFHNGKELTAEDLIYTFQETLNPKSPGEGAAALHALQVKDMKKIDKHTISLPFSRPLGTLTQVLSTNIAPYAIPVGFDVKKPVGTGPFKYKSFTPGEESVFERNADYWEAGLPYADSLVITDYSDATSQADALISGEANLISGLSTEVEPTIRGGGKKLLISEGGGWNPFTMRVDREPFSDVRVRQAMRYIVNRHEMREAVFEGLGTIGNDIFGIWAEEYDHDIPQRVQDVDKAKSLLKAAGHEHLTVQLVTSDIAQGVVEMATVFAEQASAAGVKVNINNVDDFFGPNYLKWVFAQDYWDYNYYLPQVADATLPTAPYNECHFDDPHYTKLYSEAVATTDETKRIAIAHEMQLIDYNTGGYIIPFFIPVIDGYDPSVHGLVASRSGISFNNYDFKSMWLS